MRFASPVGFAAAALAVPLVLWYVLRARRPRHVVASTFLWRQADRTAAAAVPWQRFRGDVTFWLVLAAILLGAVALARPYVPVEASLGDHTILIVDASASMLADEGGPSRLELARRRAEELVAGLGPGQTVSVVEAGPRARVLLSASEDSGGIRDALGRVRVSHGQADLVDAFTLAAALERPGQDTVFHLLSDAEVPDAAAEAVPPGTVLTAVGSDRPNVAVTRVQALPRGAGSTQVFVQVRNYAQAAVEVMVRVADGASGDAAAPASDTAAGGTLLVSRSTRLPPRGTEDLVLDVVTPASGVLVASVNPAPAGAADALSADDRAFAVVSEPRDVDVLLAGPGNVFLEAALEAQANVRLDTAPQIPADLGETDLLIVDRVPAPPSPDVPVLYVAPTDPPRGVDVAGALDRPALTFQSPDHELLGSVDLSSVAIASAQRVEAPELTPVAASPDGPLVLAGRLGGDGNVAGGVPVLYLAFDLHESNLPLQATWPILVANAVSWLAGPPTLPPAEAGQPVSLAVPAGALRGTVTGPEGRTDLDPANPRFVPEQAGVHEIAWEARADDSAADGDGEQVTATRIAVNVPAGEGDLALPRPAEPVVFGSPGSAGEGGAEGRRSFVREALLAVLVLVVAEWLWTVIGGRSRRGGSRSRGFGRSRSAAPREAST